MKIEICANSVASALAAQIGGAHRVELCAGMPEGGTTPSMGEVSVARDRLKTTKLHVIIRPRGGDFLYSETEQDVMLRDVRMVKQIGVDGVVFGALTADGDVDMPFMRSLMAEAEGLSVTFHRAFDMCRNPQKALEDIINLGIDRILTSGQQATAEAGIPLLKELVAQAANRIIIMPGCGVNADNIRKIAAETGATEFHFSARTEIESKMRYRNPNVSMGGTVTIDEYKIAVTDPEKVRVTLKTLVP